MDSSYQKTNSLSIKKSINIHFYLKIKDKYSFFCFLLEINYGENSFFMVKRRGRLTLDSE